MALTTTQPTADMDDDYFHHRLKFIDWLCAAYAKKVLFITIVASLFIGCNKPSDVASLATPSPAPEASSTPVVSEPLPPAPTPAPPVEPLVPATPAPDRSALPETEVGLEARYLSASSLPADREEVIRALGRIQTAAASQTLARIFVRERRLTAKMEVIEVVADDHDPACTEGKLAVLRAGVAPTQPPSLRLAALQALLDVDDPRVLPILQPLASDADPLVRSQAAEELAKRH